MLKKSAWNKPGVLTSESEYIGADKGYTTTQYINVLKPFSEPELKTNPEFGTWNKAFNKDRGLIERMFAILKGRFGIFAAPWKRHKQLFPLALRVSLKLLNFYWRLPGNTPPGLTRQKKWLLHLSE